MARKLQGRAGAPPTVPTRLRYPVKEAAVLLNLSPSTVWGLIRTGRLKPVRSGKRVHLTHEELVRHAAKDHAAVS